MLKFIQKNLIDTTRLTPEEKWEKATIANNFIFYKIMQNNHDVCKELLEILLKIKIDHIEMHNEEIIEIDYGKKESVLMFMQSEHQKLLIWKCKLPIQANFQKEQDFIRPR